MPLLTRFRSRSLSSNALGVDTVGHATVVHAPAGMTPAARALADQLPADPDNELIVADLPPTASSADWEHLALAVPRGRGGIRLVTEGPSRGSATEIASWLAERLDRTVLAADGTPRRDLGGTVFVDAGPASGWIRHTPGHPPEWAAKRFPQPSWEARTVSDSFRAGPTCVTEPLPAGVWLRPEADPVAVNADRTRLRHSIPCRSDVLTVVLGGRSLPPLSLGDVRALWAALSTTDRHRVRFVHFGPVAVPAGSAIGGALAGLLGEEVTFFAGIPVGTSDAADVRLLRADGSHGWNSFARELAYTPDSPPTVRGHRPPCLGMREIAPATYRYSADVVVEVVPAGLWVRTNRDASGASAVRGAPVDPTTAKVIYDDAASEITQLTMPAARDLLLGLDFATRLAATLVPAVTLGHPSAARPSAGARAEPAATAPAPADTTPAGDFGDVDLPWLAQLLEEDSLPAAGVPDLPQPRGEATISGILSGAEPADAAPPQQPPPDEPDGDVDAAHAWLREYLDPRWVEQVRPVLAAAGSVDEPALLDAAALASYLGGASPDLDEQLRTGTAGGPHRLVARAATTALAALPRHRGATVTRLTTTAAQRERIRGAEVLHEQGFHTMLAGHCTSLEGDTELFVWSMNGRAVTALEEADNAVDGRIVFGPGTAFKVLHVGEPDSDGAARIVLRELSPSEVRGDGSIEPNRRSLDRLASTATEKFAGRLAADPPLRRIPAGAMTGPMRVPGAGDD